MKRYTTLLTASTILLSVWSCTQQKSKQTPDEAKAIAKEACTTASWWLWDTMKVLPWLLIFVFIVLSLNIFSQKKDTDKVGGVRGGWQSAVMVEDGANADTDNNLSTFYHRRPLPLGSNRIKERAL